MANNEKKESTCKFYFLKNSNISFSLFQFIVVVLKMYGIYGMNRERGNNKKRKRINILLYEFIFRLLKRAGLNRKKLEPKSV